MIKGILIELQENYGVMLTDEGQFLKIKRFGTMIEGQPLYLTEEDIIMDSRIENDHRSHVVDMKHPEKTSKVRKLNTAFLGIIAASMLIFAISATWFFATANTIYTAVIVDINPSIELQLNKNNKVVKLVALNDDALSLDLSALRGKQIEDALELLVSDAGAKGYFLEGDDDYVLVTTVAMKEQSIEALQTRLMQKFEDSDVLQRTNMAFTVITPEQLDDAKENEIPAGLVMIASSGSDTTVKKFFKDEDNVKAFENSGVLVRGTSVDSVTSATTNSSGIDDDESDDDDGDDDSVSEMTQDLKERLIKLKGVTNPSVTIKAFIVKADAYFSTGTGDLRTLTTEAKSLWDGVKGEDDDLDDNSDDDNEGDDEDEGDDDSNKEDDDDDDSDATTSATQSTTSSTQNTTSTTGSSSDTIADQRADLSERLLKLKGVSNPSDTIKAFIVKADAYFASGTGNLAALTVEAKLLWNGVKDDDDDSDDDSDATTSATQSTTSSTQNTTSTTGSSDDTIADQRADLSERLLKLKGVSNPSDKIKTFIVKADAYFATGTGNLTALYEESKMLWDTVKDSDDDRDDDEDEDEDNDEDDDEDDEDDDENDDEDEDEDEGDDD